MRRSTSAPSTTRPKSWAVVFCVVVIATVFISGTVERQTRARSGLGSVSTWPAATTVSQARSNLADLAIVELAPEVAYDRTSDFGQAWADVDRNGCDTRNDILVRDLTDITFRTDDSPCVVLEGALADPYTGQAIHFTRSAPAEVQIDHLVPLHAAWMLGAWRWTPARRLAFANDPINLVAVDGSANQRKSDSLADRWQPPNQRVRCTYAINTIAVHDTYDLGTTAAEHRELEHLLRSCP